MTGLAQQALGVPRAIDGVGIEQADAERNMDWDDLRLFLAAARHGGLAARGAAATPDAWNFLARAAAAYP